MNVNKPKWMRQAMKRLHLAVSISRTQSVSGRRFDGYNITGQLSVFSVLLQSSIFMFLKRGEIGKNKYSVLICLNFNSISLSSWPYLNPLLIVLQQIFSVLVCKFKPYLNLHLQRQAILCESKFCPKKKSMKIFSFSFLSSWKC